MYERILRGKTILDDKMKYRNTLQSGTDMWYSLYSLHYVPVLWTHYLQLISIT